MASSETSTETSSSEDFELIPEDEDLPRATENVPWPRHGSPSGRWDNGERHGGRKWGNKIGNMGDSSQRLLSDDQLVYGAALHTGTICKGTMAERCAAELWDYENNKPYGGSILWTLLSEFNGNLIKTVNDRKIAEVAAASIVRWLQTNIGSGFMEQVARNTASERKRLAPQVLKQMDLLLAMGMLDPETVKQRKRDLEWSLKKSTK